MSTHTGLSKKQQSLVNELHEIYGLLGLDFYRIHQSSASNKTKILRSNLISIVRGEIIWLCNVVDTAMNSKILLYLFPDEDRRKSEGEAFKEHLLERTGSLKKLEFLKKIVRVPKHIQSRVKEIVELRNAVAHSLYPLDLTERPRKTNYRGENIYSAKGVSMLHKDWYTVVKYLLEF